MKDDGDNRYPSTFDCPLAGKLVYADSKGTVVIQGGLSSGFQASEDGEYNEEL
jgi:hypothetical protein